MRSHPLIALLAICFLCCDTCGQELLTRSSCGTSSCHGGALDAGQPWNHSLTHFVAKDPHALAGHALKSERSQQIVQNLNPQATIVSATAYMTVLKDRCVSCHVTVTASDYENAATISQSRVSEGVSCESCHGPASQWVEMHYLDDWRIPEQIAANSEEGRQLHQQRYATTHFRDNNSIVGRTKTCVRCHVGSRSDDGIIRDMNHDLIAAGHPAFRFDLLTYLDNLPAHWSRDSDSETSLHRSAVFTRKVSRRVSLVAAADLTAERATAHLSGQGTVWPELSDFDCFSCHQSLNYEKHQYGAFGRSGDSLSPTSSTSPRWNPWYVLGLASENTLRTKLSLGFGNAKEVAKRAEDFATTQQAELVRLMSLNQDSEQSREKLLREALNSIRYSSSQPPKTWIEAAVRYLEIEAAFRDASNTSELSAAGQYFLQRVRSEIEPVLRFDTGSASHDPRLRSPARFDHEVVASAFRNIFSTPPLTSDDENPQRLLLRHREQRQSLIQFLERQ